jgi:prevent-host-death family protein
MTNFNVHEAQRHLFSLIVRAMDGEEIVITMSGKPVARLLPVGDGYLASRIPGIDKGKLIIKPDFDEPLHEFE